MSALDALDALNASLKTAEKKEEKRPELTVPVAALEAFKRLVPVQHIMKIAKARADIEGDIVSEEMLKVYATALFKEGSRPINPRLVVQKDGKPDMSGLYQVQEKWGLNYAKGPEPVNIRIVNALLTAGFSREMAVKIVDKEVDWRPMTVLLPLDELVQGSDLQKSAAVKVINLMSGQPALPLTPEERAASVKKVENVEVRGGFLDRCKDYCFSEVQLLQLFKVIRPTNFVSHTKYGESDTEEERTQKLAEQAKQLILGSAK